MCNFVTQQKITMNTSTTDFDFQPDNTHLLTTIKAFQTNQNQDTFMAVLNELQGDYAFLLIPTTEPVVGKDRNEEGWSTIEKGTQLSFTSVFEVDNFESIGSLSALRPETTKCPHMIKPPSLKHNHVTQSQNFHKALQLCQHEYLTWYPTGYDQHFAT